MDSETRQSALADLSMHVSIMTCNSILGMTGRRSTTGRQDVIRIGLRTTASEQASATAMVIALASLVESRVREIGPTGTVLATAHPYQTLSPLIKQPSARGMRR